MNPVLIATFHSVTESLLSSSAFGAPAVYTGDGGTLAIQAIIDTAQSSIGDYGQILESRPVAILARAVIGEPKRGDTLTCNGLTYLVDGVVADQSDDYIVTVALKVDT